MVLNKFVKSFSKNDSTYRPHQKPDSIIQYMYAKSHHPPHKINQIPPPPTPPPPPQKKKCLSQLSSDEVTFTESAPFCEDKLHQFGY